MLNIKYVSISFDLGWNMFCCFALLGSARIVQTTLPHPCRTQISPVSRGSPSTDKMGTRSLKSSPAVGVHCKWLAVPNQIFSDEPSQFTLHLSIQLLTWNHRSLHTISFSAKAVSISNPWPLRVSVQNHHNFRELKHTTTATATKRHRTKELMSRTITVRVRSKSLYIS